MSDAITNARRTFETLLGMSFPQIEQELCRRMQRTYRVTPTIRTISELYEPNSELGHKEQQDRDVMKDVPYIQVRDMTTYDVWRFSLEEFSWCENKFARLVERLLSRLNNDDNDNYT